MKKIIIGIFSAFLLVAGAISAVSPVPVSAQQVVPVGSGNPRESTFQLVPCTGVVKKDAAGNVISGKVCDFNALVEMANRFIKFLLYLSIPFILAIIMYTAYLYLTANGSAPQLAKAKQAFKYVAVGLAWILVSFILVYTVLDRLLADNIKNDQQGIWNSYFKK
jgi:hypothetical protein